MEQENIHALVSKAQNGDQKAFSMLYDEFADRLYKFISFKISDPQAAEDLLQEVFIKAWRGCSKLKLENLNFSAWLYTIASNTIKNHFRQIYRRPQTTSLEEDMNIASTDDTSRSVNSTFNTEMAKKMLINLPPNYKQILELRFIQELNVEETANIIGKSHIAVRVIQYRALKQLKNLFKNYET